MPASITIETGEFAGWETWPGEPFDGRAGPFFHRHDADGGVRCAFRAEQGHTNGLGRVHGGCLLTLADYCMFAVATTHLHDSNLVTATLNSEFVSAGIQGDLIEATGEVIKAGRTMVIVRGIVSVRAKPLLTFSGTMVRINPAA